MMFEQTGSSSYSNVLESINVNVVSDTNCNTAWVDCCSAPIASSTMICAKADGQGACKWDEGGPLFTGSGSSATQVRFID